MNKYLLTVLLCLIVYGTIKAEEWFESGLFRYEILTHVGSGGTVKITGFNRNVDAENIETLDIPSEVPTYSYKIVEIGSNAFSYSRNLKKVVIANTITKIGNNAFIGCNQLEAISLSSHVTEIDKYAFAGCSSLATLNIPNSVKNIGEGAFQNCSSLLQISLPKNLTTITASLFKGCSSLYELTLPNSITTIDDYAFRGCDMLLDISLPDGLISIGNFAFADCKEIKRVNIPTNVQWIGMNPFSGCTSIESFNIDGNKNYHVYDGALYESNPLKLIACPASNKNIDVQPLTEIFSYSCFSGCEYLEDIRIPKTIREICSDAFYGCSSLNTIQCEIEDVFSCNPGFSNYNATLYVPKGLIDIYSEVEPWKNFKNIKEITSSSIDETYVNTLVDFYILGHQIFFESEKNIQIWNMSGHLIYNGVSTNIPKLDNGIYLLTWSNNAHKIFIK